MINIHHPCILALLETKMVDHRNISYELGFHNFIESSVPSNSDGTVIMWKEDDISITSISISTQTIHASVKVSSFLSTWLLRIIYANNDFNFRKLFWDQLISLADAMPSLGSNSWVVEGDFNEVLRTSKILGGNPINIHMTSLFWGCINKCNLIDVGFIGRKFTWSSMTYKNRQGLILERLDRCLANDQ